MTKIHNTDLFIFHSQNDGRVKNREEQKFNFSFSTDSPPDTSRAWLMAIRLLRWSLRGPKFTILFNTYHKNT